jgi:hypothetical protein
MKIREEIENIFRSSNSSDELFDAFQSALKNKISDVDFYKILLGNPALSTDEIKMYASKLCSEFPDFTFDICMWTADLFLKNIEDYRCIADALAYYKNAAESKPAKHEPYLAAIKLYNYDLEIPTNKQILSMVDKGMPSVDKKSKVFFAMAELYKKLGNRSMYSECFTLAQQAAQRES